MLFSCSLILRLGADAAFFQRAESNGLSRSNDEHAAGRKHDKTHGGAGKHLPRTVRGGVCHYQS